MFANLFTLFLSQDSNKNDNWQNDSPISVMLQVLWSYLETELTMASMYAIRNLT